MLKNDVTIIAFGLLFQQVLTLGTGVAVARLLGSSGYGLVNLLRTLFTAFITLAPLGLDLSLLKFCGQHAGNQAYIFAAVQRLRLIVFVVNAVFTLGVGLGLSGPLMRWFYPYEGFDRMLLATMVGLPFAADLGILGAFYRGANRPGAFALMTLYLQPVARVVLIGIAAFTTASAFIIVCINTLQVVVSSSVVMAHLHRFAPQVTEAKATPPPWRDLRPLMIGSIWMAFSLFVYGMMRSVDILLLGVFATSKDVGEYGALATIAQLVQVYPMAASQTLGPTVSRLFHSGDGKGIKTALDNYIYMASIVASFFFAGIAVFGDRLDLVFGPSFQFGAAIAFLMPFAYLVSAILAPTGYALSMTGRHRSEFAIICLGAAGLVILCLLLIPQLGQVGAAIASSSAFLIINGLRYAYVSTVLGFVPGRWRDLLPPMVGLAAACAARWAVDSVVDRTLLALISGCVLYTLLYASAAGLFLVRRSDALSIVDDFRSKLRK